MQKCQGVVKNPVLQELRTGSPHGAGKLGKASWRWSALKDGGTEESRERERH